MNVFLRRKKIMERLNAQGIVEVKKLAELFNTSEVTVRADLRALEQKGKIRRFFGGAQLPEQTILESREKAVKEIELKDELSIISRYDINSDAKVAIAKYAAKLVPVNSTIIFDSGSTTHLIAEELAISGNITAITNNLSASIALSEAPKTTLVICGGLFRTKTRSMHGRQAQQCLDGVCADLLFIGADGIDPERGITTFNEGFHISKIMADCAQKIIAVADSSKFHRSGFNQVLEIERIHTLVTDSGISPSTYEQFVDAGLEVVVV